jgi:hypothetical protein
VLDHVRQDVEGRLAAEGALQVGELEHAHRRLRAAEADPVLRDALEQIGRRLHAGERGCRRRRRGRAGRGGLVASAARAREGDERDDDDGGDGEHGAESGGPAAAGGRVGLGLLALEALATGLVAPVLRRGGGSGHGFLWSPAVRIGRLRARPEPSARAFMGP